MPTLPLAIAALMMACASALVSSWFFARRRRRAAASSIAAVAYLAEELAGSFQWDPPAERHDAAPQVLEAASTLFK